MPLLKSSLDLLQVLICFTTGHIVLGLQTFPTPFKNITVPYRSSSPHPKFLCLERDLSQQLFPFHVKRDGTRLSPLATTPCIEQEKLLQLYFLTIKWWGNVIFVKTKLETTRGLSYSKGHEGPSQSCQQAAAPKRPPLLWLSTADRPPCQAAPRV